LRSTAALINFYLFNGQTVGIWTLAIEDKCQAFESLVIYLFNYSSFSHYISLRVLSSLFRYYDFTSMMVFERHALCRFSNCCPPSVVWLTSTSRLIPMLPSSGKQATPSRLVMCMAWLQAKSQAKPSHTGQAKPSQKCWLGVGFGLAWTS
jgi:hypothetical protein